MSSPSPPRRAHFPATRALSPKNSLLRAFLARVELPMKHHAFHMIDIATSLSACPLVCAGRARFRDSDDYLLRRRHDGIRLVTAYWPESYRDGRQPPGFAASSGASAERCQWPSRATRRRRPSRPPAVWRCRRPARSPAQPAERGDGRLSAISSPVDLIISMHFMTTCRSPASRRCLKAISALVMRAAFPQQQLPRT